MLLLRNHLLIFVIIFSLLKENQRRFVVTELPQLKNEIGQTSNFVSSEHHALQDVEDNKKKQVQVQHKIIFLIK
jgi:hypothetical protein